MPLLLLVSTQITIPIMEIFDSKHDLNSLKSPKKIQIYYSENNDVILCNHCKRTANNGIRCLGMCIADNDY